MIILSGIVGSHAYGLNNEQSDVDTLGVYVHPTESYWSLDKPSETTVQTNPDITMHEIEKFLRLAIKCNPTIMELLWLEKDTYQVREHWGQRLIDLRQSFIYTDGVTNAYGGYAYAQIKKVKTSNSVRRFKHARHCFRLLRQGKELLATGNLTLKVPNPEEYKIFESMPIDQMESLFNREYTEFKAIKSILPKEPHKKAINRYLHEVRIYN